MDSRRRPTLEILAIFMGQPVMDLAGQDGLSVSLSCVVKVVSEFRGFDEALTAK